MTAMTSLLHYLKCNIVTKNVKITHFVAHRQSLVGSEVHFVVPPDRDRDISLLKPEHGELDGLAVSFLKWVVSAIKCFRLFH